MRLAFAKYEGAGNDFVLVDNRAGGFAADSGSVARLCDRHFGIGADGLMTLSCDPDGGAVMHYYNADGSEGEMCGNGARCFALFMHHLGLCGASCRFAAADGPHEAVLRSAAGASGEIEVGISPVSRIVRAGGAWPGWSLNTGVPHYVEFVDRVESVDLLLRGRAIRLDRQAFPQGTNVNFVTVTGRGSLRMRTYERGVEAETLACGTGATAAALTANFVHQPDIDAWSVDLPGGRLSVTFDREPSAARYTRIRLTGPARRVFDGTVDSSSLTNFNLNR